MDKVQEIYHYYNSIIEELCLTISELEGRVKELKQQLEEKSKYANVPPL